MSHSVLDLVANTATTLLLISTAAHYDVENAIEQIYNNASHEQQLRACGSIDAGLQNLKDEIDGSPLKLKSRLNLGLQFIQNHLERAEEVKIIPTAVQCKQSTDSRSNVTFETFRLDEIDSPERRVNWSYRFIANKEI